MDKWVGKSQGGQRDVRFYLYVPLLYICPTCCAVGRLTGSTSSMARMQSLASLLMEDQRLPGNLT